MRKYFLYASAATLMAMSAPASAATYLFTFAGTGLSGNGTFTTSDTANGNGGFAIINTVGTVTIGANTLTFTGPIGYAGADNILFPNSTPYLSGDGTSFTLSNNATANLFYSTALGAYRVFRSAGATITLTSFTLTPAAAAVPETATWAMMIAGFGMVGGAMRYRRRAAPKVAYAYA